MKGSILNLLAKAAKHPWRWLLSAGCNWTESAECRSWTASPAIVKLLLVSCGRLHAANCKWISAFVPFGCIQLFFESRVAAIILCLTLLPRCRLLLTMISVFRVARSAATSLLSAGCHHLHFASLFSLTSVEGSLICCLAIFDLENYRLARSKSSTRRRPMYLIS